jgi:hypothetical protein
MPENTATTDAVPRETNGHTGRHVFFGVLGAIFALLLAVVILGGGYLAYQLYAPAGLNDEVVALRGRIAALTSGTPVGRPTTATVDAIGPEGTITRTVRRSETYDPFDRLTEAVETTNRSVRGLNQSVGDLTEVVKGQDRKISGLGERLDTVSGNVRSLTDKFGGLENRVAALETKPAAAPVPEEDPAATPAPAPVPGVRAPAYPPAYGPGQTSRAPAPAGAGGRSADVRYSGVPENWHIGELQRRKNSEQCHGKLVWDRNSPKCYKQSDGGINCPWKCDEERR